jgi:ASC-1-like (ASCH) protein
MFHIAILHKKYYNLILSGKKTIESRFSFNKIAPYNKVKVGETIYLKESGKNITARAKVKDVKFFELNPEIVEDIRVKYGNNIGVADVDSWNKTKQKKFGTLVWLENVETINEIKTNRSCGTAWFVLENDLKC